MTIKDLIKKAIIDRETRSLLVDDPIETCRRSGISVTFPQVWGETIIFPPSTQGEYRP